MILTLLLGLHAADPPEKLRITALPGNVYVHTTYQRLNGQPFPSNGLIVPTADGVVLVDSGWGLDQTAQVLRWVRRELRQPVRLCIVTHAHDDRVGGIALLRRRGVRVVSTPHTARRAAALGFAGADSVLTNDTTLTIGGVAVRTFFPGAGHAPDNIVVWLPATGVLFGGCLVKSCEATGLGNVADANLAAWPATIRRVQQTFPAARVIVPGHQSWSCPDALDHTLRLLEQR